MNDGLLLTSREVLALEVLMDGGKFRHALESHWHGGEKFATRLLDRHGRRVHGIGFSTREKLLRARMLRTSPTAPSSTWPTEHVLA